MFTYLAVNKGNYISTRVIPPPRPSRPTLFSTAEEIACLKVFHILGCWRQRENHWLVVKIPPEAGAWQEMATWARVLYFQVKQEHFSVEDEGQLRLDLGVTVAFEAYFSSRGTEATTVCIWQKEFFPWSLVLPGPADGTIHWEVSFPPFLSGKVSGDSCLLALPLQADLEVGKQEKLLVPSLGHPGPLRCQRDSRKRKGLSPIWP